MIRWTRALGWAAAVFLLALLVGPFLVPVRPLEGTVAPRTLADPDSRFIQVGGLEVHYKDRGAGEPTFVLLHGFGASTYTWERLSPELAELGRVIAYDRAAFGLTERPVRWEGESPYRRSERTRRLAALLDALHVERAILIGNSAGGTVALTFALEHPDRVQHLVLVSPAVYAGGGAPAWLRPLLALPQVHRLGPLLVRRIATAGNGIIELAWHDPSGVTDAVLAGYRKPLRAQDWDRALWEFTRASGPHGLESRLGEVSVPTLVITGDDDRIVPTAHSVRVAGEIPGAHMVEIADCGHVPQEECPEAVLDALREHVVGGGPASRPPRPTPTQAR